MNERFLLIAITLLGSPWMCDSTVISAPPLIEKSTAPIIRYSGRVEDIALERLLPHNGLVKCQKELAVLWKGWKLGNDVPEVDFESYFVLVITKHRLQPTLVGLFHKADGDSDVGLMTDEQNSLKGFGVSFGVFPYNCVKKIHGNPIVQVGKSK